MNLCIAAREFLAQSRRRRLYASRFVFGGVIFASVAWSAFEVRGMPQEADAGVFSSAARGVFEQAMQIQGAFVLIATPALFAGAFVAERKRKTLHDLLLTPLSGWEIALGQSLARLSGLGALLLVGLPIAGLLSLLGGIDPLGVLLLYAVTISMAFLIGAFSLWVSAGASNLVLALTFVYLLVYAWLFVPMILTYAPVGFLPAAILAALKALNTAIAPSCPLMLYDPGRRFQTLRASYAPVVAMIAIQSIYGLAFLVLAGRRLRRDFSRLEGRAGAKAPARPGRTKPAKPARLRLRSPETWLDGRPMLARELFSSLMSRRAQWAIVLFYLGCLAPLVLSIVSGYFVRGALLFHEEVTLLSAVLATVWMLTVAGLSGASLALEVESDTWTSLLVTPLEPREIVRSKQIASVLKTLWILVPMFGLWVFDAVVGGLSPIGLAAAVILIAVLGWFASSAGMLASLLATVTQPNRRPITAGILGAQAFLFSSFVATLPIGLMSWYCGGPEAIALAGAGPYALRAALLSPDALNLVSSGTPISQGIFESMTRLDFVSLIVSSLLWHAALAFCLAALAIESFDRLAGRIPARRRLRAQRLS